VQPAQLDYYLDEFTFRFNRRTSRSRRLLFYRLLELLEIDADPFTTLQPERRQAVGKAAHAVRNCA
jgi:hypothetical protein